jgi:broad specificity phosphatase PhoE
MIRIYIVSNGETDSNNEMLIQPDNIPLNSNGIEQAKKTGKYLNSRKDKIDFILSSPLERSKQTAEIIAKEVNYTDKTSYDPNLSDIKINDKYKNLTKTEFKNLENTDENVKKFYKFKEKKDNIACPIEKNEFTLKNAFSNDIYENEVEIKERIKKVMDTIITLNVKNVVIITHNKIIKLLIKTILKILSNDIIINDKLNCSITYFVHTDGDFYLLANESNKHLDCV